MSVLAVTSDHAILRIRSHFALISFLFFAPSMVRVSVPWPAAEVPIAAAKLELDILDYNTFFPSQLWYGSMGKVQQSGVGVAL